MSQPNKMSADATWAAGQVKSTVGSALGNQSMKAEGDAKIAQGDAEYKAAQAQGYSQGTKDDLAGRAKNVGNKIVGDDAGQAQAKAQQAKGQSQKEWNS